VLVPSTLFAMDRPQRPEFAQIPKEVKELVAIDRFVVHHFRQEVGHQRPCQFNHRPNVASQGSIDVDKDEG
jgi:hypothetical protein